MSSLYRLFPTAKNGQKIIDLTKMASITVEDKELTFVYNNVKNNITGSFIFFSGGNNKSETYTYKTEEDAQRSFNSIKNDLENFSKK
jgi:hypothetical protein